MSTLRQLLSSDSSKPYYLSAAPQCPRPDASIPVPELLDYVDFFGVQFYNNPACQLNAGQGFLDSLQAWSGDLEGSTGSSKRSTSSGERSPRDHQFDPSSRRRTRAKRTGSGSFLTTNNGITSPRLLIGTPAFPGAGGGYVNVSTYESILEEVKALELPNLAGAMFWDGAYEEVSGQVIATGGPNTTFAEVVRQVL